METGSGRMAVAGTRVETSGEVTITPEMDGLSAMALRRALRQPHMPAAAKSTIQPLLHLIAFLSLLFLRCVPLSFHVGSFMLLLLHPAKLMFPVVTLVRVVLYLMIPSVLQLLRHRLRTKPTVAILLPLGFVFIAGFLKGGCAGLGLAGDVV